MRAYSLDPLAYLGETDQVLEEAESVAVGIQATGDKDYTGTRVLQARLLAERGTPRDVTDLDAFLADVRELGEPSRTATALVVGLQSRLVRGRLDQAQALEADLARLVDEGAVIYADLLPTALRAVLVIGDQPLAQRLVGLIKPGTVLARLGLASSRAQLAEAAGTSSKRSTATRRQRTAGKPSETSPNRPTPVSAKVDASSRSARRAPRNPWTRRATCSRRLGTRRPSRRRRSSSRRRCARPHDGHRLGDRPTPSCRGRARPACALEPRRRGRAGRAPRCCGAAPPAGRPRAPVAPTPGRPARDDRPARPHAGLAGDRVPSHPRRAEARC